MRPKALVHDVSQISTFKNRRVSLTVAQMKIQLFRFAYSLWRDMCVTQLWKQHIRWKAFEWAFERWAALPFIFSPLSLSSTLSLSLSSRLCLSLSLALLLPPRGPRVALPTGLASNHPELVGGNRRLPAGCLVTADPWDTHTHSHSYTHKLNTHTTLYMLTKAFAVISWHLSIHVSPTTRSCQGHSLAT